MCEVLHTQSLRIISLRTELHAYNAPRRERQSHATSPTARCVALGTGKWLSKNQQYILGVKLEVVEEEEGACRSVFLFFFFLRLYQFNNMYKSNGPWAMSAQA